MAHRTPEDKARTHFRQQLADAAQAAPDAGQHPGHWSLHHIMLPEPRPGDLTPIRPADYAEHEAAPRGDLLRYLAEMFDIDHAQQIAEYGNQLQANAKAGQ